MTLWLFDRRPEKQGHYGHCVVQTQGTSLGKKLISEIQKGRKKLFGIQRWQGGKGNREQGHPVS